MAGDMGASSESLEGLRERFQEDGYVVVRNALGPGEIGSMRQHISAYFESPGAWRYLQDGKAKSYCFQFDPDDVFVPLLRHPRIAEALKAIHGDDIVFANECGLGTSGASGWHKDTHGQDDIFDRAKHADFGVCKVLVYPQDQIGRDARDFALKVRRGSHWLPTCDAGREESIYIRAGDAILIDVRTTHRGQVQLGEEWGVLRRAAYYPVRHYTPGLSYRARQAYERAVGRTPRQLATLLYGRKNEFTTRYLAQGQREKDERWGLGTSAPLPDTWRRALDAVSIGTL
jgi:hypothetical protein